MLSSPNVSSLSVIMDIRNAIAFAKRSNKQVQINVAGIQLTVRPNSDPSELVCLWETEFEKREK